MIALNAIRSFFSRKSKSWPHLLPSALAETLEPRRLLSTYTADINSPVAWTWYQGVTAGFLAQQVYAQHAQIVDLKVQSSSPLTFAAALVQNSGPYASQWWWDYGETSTQLTASLDSRNARLVSLDPYVDSGGNVLFASLMVPNTGASAKTWWYYAGQTSDDITNTLSQNNGRLIDLEPYTVGGQTFYADVMISNTGADQQGWWWYTGIDTAAISSLITTNSARVVSMSAETNGTFDIIMEANPQVGWWWYYGESAASLQSTANENEARIFDVDPYQDNGQTAFSALMVGNGNPLETTVSNTLEGADAGATTGAYLQQVDGPVLADYNGETRFEPASAIKILLAATALTAVQNGQASLSDTITYYYDPNDPTNPGVNPDGYDHTPANAATIDLQDGIGQMLEVSDNRITDAMAAQFGFPAINAEAQAIGMTDSVWGADIGGGVVGNFLTLHDVDLLYGKLLDGTLLNPAMTSLLESLILNQTNYGLNSFTSVIDDQAAAVLGVGVGDDSATTLANNFIAATMWGSKGGSYDIYNSDATIDEVIRTEGGYFELPVMNADGSMSYKDYAYGVFVDNANVAIVSGDNPAIDQINNTLNTAKQQLVTGIITEALQTWVAGHGLNTAAQVAFAQQPTDSVGGELLSPTITVNVEDADGNVVPLNDDTVTLSIATGPAGATLDGSTTLQAVDGVATFNEVYPSIAGSYTLLATDGGNTVASQSFTISSPFSSSTGANLAFIQQPTDATTGTTLTPPVTVGLLDPSTGAILFNDNANVTLTLNTGNLAGTITEPAINGVATFGDLSIAAPGSYTLTAGDGGDTPVASNSFAISSVVVQPPPTQPFIPSFVRETAPTAIVADAALHGSYVVSVVNQGQSRSTGPVTIKVFASTDGSIDDSATLVGTIVRHVNLQSGQRQSFVVPIKAAAGTLAAGSYTLLAQTTDLAGISNAAGTGPALNVAAPFVALAASIGAASPTMIKAGHHATVAVTFTNNGNIPSTGAMTIDIGLSIDGTTQAAVLTALTRNVKILPGRKTVLHLRFTVAETQPAGAYFPSVSVSQNGNSAAGIGNMPIQIEA